MSSTSISEHGEPENLSSNIYPLAVSGPAMNESEQACFGNVVSGLVSRFAGDGKKYVSFDFLLYYVCTVCMIQTAIYVH